MVNQIYPSEFQLIKANTPDTGCSFLDLHLFISNDIVSTKIYDKRDDISHFEMAIFLDLHLMEFIFVNSSDLLENLAMLQTSPLAIQF